MGGKRGEDEKEERKEEEQREGREESLQVADSEHIMYQCHI